MSSNDRPVSTGSMLKISVARGVNHLMRRPRSTNTVAMSVEIIRFCKSLLARPTSSTLAFNS